MGANANVATPPLRSFPVFHVDIFTSSVAAYSKNVDDTKAKKKQIRFHDHENEIGNSDANLTMSSNEEQQDDNIFSCTSCGISEDEGTHFKACDTCDLVQYCSDDCQKEHRPANEESCQKRAAELHDKIVFQQPENTHLGDCPICLLPLPDDISTHVMESCCSTFICNGCSYANRQRELEDNLEQRCPFCRVTPPATNEEGEVKKMKRVEANDPVALCEVGKKHYHDGNTSAAFEYWKRAVEVEGEGPGAVGAHAHLSAMYQMGLGGAEKNEKKELYHLEVARAHKRVAAIAGHPDADARYSLANYEGRHGNEGRAVKHLIIAVKQGSSDAIKKFKKMYGQGMIKKEGFAACLRVYQKAVEATKSPQREAAAKSVAQGSSPWAWERVQTQAQSQTQRQRPLDRTRMVNGLRGSREGKKSSKKGKVKQAKQHDNQKTSFKKQPLKKV